MSRQSAWCVIPLDSRLRSGSVIVRRWQAPLLFSVQRATVVGIDTRQVALEIQQVIMQTYSKSPSYCPIHPHLTRPAISFVQPSFLHTSAAFEVCSLASLYCERPDARRQGTSCSARQVGTAGWEGSPLMVTARSGQEAALPRRRRAPLPSEMAGSWTSVSPEQGWDVCRQCRNAHVVFES